MRDKTCTVMAEAPAVPDFKAFSIISTQLKLIPWQS